MPRPDPARVCHIPHSSIAALQRLPQSRAWSISRRSRLVGRPSCRGGGRLGCEPAHFCGLRARGDALGRFLIQLLRDGRGAAHGAEPAHHHRARHMALAQRHGIAAAQFPRRLGGLSVHHHAALADLFRRQGPGLVEARAPQPLVQAHRFGRGHGGIFPENLGVPYPAGHRSAKMADMVSARRWRDWPASPATCRPDRPPAMRPSFHRLALRITGHGRVAASLLVVAALAGCGDTARLPAEAGIGPGPRCRNRTGP